LTNCGLHVYMHLYLSLWALTLTHAIWNIKSAKGLECFWYKEPLSLAWRHPALRQLNLWAFHFLASLNNPSMPWYRLQLCYLFLHNRQFDILISMVLLCYARYIMSPCHHNNVPFCFRASLLFDVLQFVLHNLPTFLCFFMHPRPSSNPLTLLFLLQCIHHWLIASIRYNYCKSFYKKRSKCVHCSIWRSCIACTLVVQITCYNIVSTWQFSLHELQVKNRFSLPFESCQAYMFICIFCAYMDLFFFLFHCYLD
jgi:hypothetical protein